MSTHDAPAQVGYSWTTSGAGALLTFWQWFTDGMSPLAALLAFLTVILTAIKIYQEVRAVRDKTEERTALQKLLDKLTRKSGFDELHK